MKKLQLKKMKISKIDHINTIMGGFTTGDTTEDPADLKSKFVRDDDTILVLVCPTQTGTDRRTVSGNTTNIAETNGCGE